MSRIRQYRPAFFEGFKNETAEFDTVEELEKIPFVKKFAEGDGFFQFSIADEHLMAEYERGTRWHVVGTLVGERPDLPEWIHPDREARA